MKYILLTICFMLSAFFGCQSKSNSDSPSLFTNDLAGDAYKTYVSHGRAIRAGTENPSDEIPPAYWADRIKALNPVKVYIHRVNIVVVQSSNGIERGKYIYIPISSYLPQSGDDGFQFTPNPLTGNTYSLGSVVFDFQRTI